MITRLAPTPSGFIHTGNIYNFLLNWLWARSNGGRVLLRIDDADAARKRPEYVEDIFRVLEWLGLDWDIGPSGPDDFEKNWSQAHRQHLYEGLLKQLAAARCLFACNCSRSRLGGRGLPYPGWCSSLELPLDTPGVSWRVKMGSKAPVSIPDKAAGLTQVQLAAAAGAFVVRRKDGIAAYQLASLADDRFFGITHIGRGLDLLPSTAMQLYLDQLLDAPCFSNCRFWHHPLLTAADGNKFSKSAGHLAQSTLLSSSKQELLSAFARWMGWHDADGLADMIGRAVFIEEEKTSA